MPNNDELRAIVQELVEAMQFQTKELESVIAQLEQQTMPLAQPHQLSVVVSQLSALHSRIKKLTG